jgi:hypothetical protein
MKIKVLVKEIGKWAEKQKNNLNGEAIKKLLRT